MTTGWPTVSSTAPRTDIDDAIESGLPAPAPLVDTGRGVRHVLGPPHRGIDLGVRIERPSFGGTRQAGGHGLAGDDDGDAPGRRAKRRDRGIQRTGRQARIGHLGRELTGGEQEHPVRDGPRLRDDRAQADAREDERVVRLADLLRRPATSTASNGEPVATSARPPVQARTSAGVASATDVGLESGSTIGRSSGWTRSSISRITVSENVPATPVVPTRIVGRRRRIVSTRSGVAPETAGTARSAFDASRSARPACTRPFVSTVAIASRTTSSGTPASRMASRRSRPIPIPAAPAPTSTIRASASERPVARRPDKHASHDDRGRARDVVVERGDAVAVALDEPHRVVLLEVLELDQAARPDLLDAGHERLDERVVLRAAQPRRSIAQVQRICEQRGVVRSDVERYRQGQRRVDAARRRVQRELADRDGHAACALIAEPQDPLVVGHDDEPHVLERPLAEDVRDPSDVGRRDPRAARPPDDVAEFLARPPDRRRVDDRQELLEVVGEESIEQRRVAVLERGEPDVLLERVGLDAQVLELELDLLLDREHAGREEAAQPERLALLDREGEVLRQQAAAEERRPGQRDPCRATGDHVVERGRQRLHGPSMVRAMEPLPPGFRWPDGVRAAAMFGFDLDAEAVMLADHPEVADYLDVIAHQRYGPRVAVPAAAADAGSSRAANDVLRSRLGRRDVARCRAVRARRRPRDRPPRLPARERAWRDEATEEGYLLRGLEALDTVLGVRPTGYRAPSWDMNFRTPALLTKHGFRYDSGLMDSDHPYRLAAPPDAATDAAADAATAAVTGAAGPTSATLIELPVHWSLDDWNRWNYVPGYASSPILRPSDVEAAWAEELDAIVDVGGLFNLTMHPFVSGRPARAAAIERLIVRARAIDGLWIAAGDEIAAWVETLDLPPVTHEPPDFRKR